MNRLGTSDTVFRMGSQRLFLTKFNELWVDQPKNQHNLSFYPALYRHFCQFLMISGVNVSCLFPGPYFSASPLFIFQNIRRSEQTMNVTVTVCVAFDSSLDILQCLSIN